MERVTARQMAQLQYFGWNFDVVSQRPWGSGHSLFSEFDREAEATEYRGRFGWRSHSEFADMVARRSREASVLWVVGSSLGAVRAATRMRRPIVLSHHYHHFERTRDKLRWRGFYELCRAVQHITFPTEFTMNEALCVAPWLTDRAHVVHNGIEVQYTSESVRIARRRAARRSLGIPDEAFVVGNAGWLIPRKRFDVFIATASEVIRYLPNARFEICGAGPLEESLKTLAKSRGLGDRITFRGSVQSMDVHYQAWDACLFNSDFDTLPTTPLEAASFGCIIVASLSYGGLSEFVTHGRNGALFARHDVPSLTCALVQAAFDDRLAVSWREAARATLQANYAPEQCARSLSAILSP